MKYTYKRDIDATAKYLRYNKPAIMLRNERKIMEIKARMFCFVLSWVGRPAKEGMDGSR